MGGTYSFPGASRTEEERTSSIDWLLTRVSSWIGHVNINWKDACDKHRRYLIQHRRIGFRICTDNIPNYWCFTPVRSNKIYLYVIKISYLASARFAYIRRPARLCLLFTKPENAFYLRVEWIVASPFHVTNATKSRRNILPCSARKLSAPITMHSCEIGCFSWPECWQRIPSQFFWHCLRLTN